MKGNIQFFFIFVSSRKGSSSLTAVPNTDIRFLIQKLTVKHAIFIYKLLIRSRHSFLLVLGIALSSVLANLFVF